MDYSFFKNKKVLVTGHTGFKGSWLICWLHILGASVIGISLRPQKISHFNLIKKKIKFKNYYQDIRNFKAIDKIISKTKPDLVFHLAAQAIVSKSYVEPRLTYETNVLGSFNILNALNKINNKCSVVMITSDKCYENLELKRGYHEKDRLGGDDFYSSSKASTEILINSYYKSFILGKNKKLKVVTARAGNVIGGGDWSRDRLVPDCMVCWKSGKTVKIRNPQSTRPWQHVLEALNGYLYLSYNMTKKNLNGESFNFSNNKIKNFTVRDFILKLSESWKRAKWEFEKNPMFKETNLLQLNNKKASKILKWKNKLKLSQTIKLVSDWYFYLYKSKKRKVLTFEQIQFFSKLKG